MEGREDLAIERTAGFPVLVFSHLFSSLNALSKTRRALEHLFVNPWLWGAMALSLLVQVAVVKLPVLNTAFGTVPMTLEQWLVCAAMGSVVLG